MNKFGVVLGIAAVATLAGCKDPDYKRSGVTAQNEVKNVAEAPVAAPAPVAVEPMPAKCTCAPGTKHSAPCACGSSDCKCVVETKPVITADLSKKTVEPEYTIYVVQNGDYLAKISKKFNVTIASIKRLNPSIKKDVVRVGQKLKLPGKIDVGVQSAPVAAASVTAAPVAAVAAKKAAPKKAFTPYAGATKEYAVQNGDTLGSIAYGNGITIRQLKELNGLSSDSLKIGQKLKIPAEKVVKAEKAKPAETVGKRDAAVAPVAAPVEEKKSEAAVQQPVAEAKSSEETASVAAEAVAAPVEEKKSEPASAATYVVQEGDDMTGVSIRWGVSAAQIRELNNLGEGDQLVPGQIIKLPADAQQ